MAESGNPWAALVEAAQQVISQIESGNTLAAQDFIRAVTIGLRDVLDGRLPDPEQREYLRFLLTALEQISSGVDPSKALGLWADNRPNSVPPERDFLLFLRVGHEFDALAAEAHTTPVDLAIARVASKTGLGDSTIRKAWNDHGGKAAWVSAHTEDK